MVFNLHIKKQTQREKGTWSTTVTHTHGPKWTQSPFYSSPGIQMSMLLHSLKCVHQEWVWLSFNPHDIREEWFSKVKGIFKKANGENRQPWVPRSCLSCSPDSEVRLVLMGERKVCGRKECVGTVKGASSLPLPTRPILCWPISIAIGSGASPHMWVLTLDMDILFLCKRRLIIPSSMMPPWAKATLNCSESTWLTSLFDPLA